MILTTTDVTAKSIARSARSTFGDDEFRLNPATALSIRYPREFGNILIT